MPGSKWDSGSTPIPSFMRFPTSDSSCGDLNLFMIFFSFCFIALFCSVFGSQMGDLCYLSFFPEAKTSSIDDWLFCKTYKANGASCFSAFFVFFGVIMFSTGEKMLFALPKLPSLSFSFFKFLFKNVIFSLDTTLLMKLSLSSYFLGAPLTIWSLFKVSIAMTFLLLSP